MKFTTQLVSGTVCTLRSFEIHPNDWVLWVDVEPLLEQIRQLEEEVDRLNARLGDITG